MDRRSFVGSLLGFFGLSSLVGSSGLPAIWAPGSLKKSVENVPRSWRERVTAVMIENQIKNDGTGGKNVIATRQFYQNTNLFDIVSVQPMLLDAGMVYYLKFRTKSGTWEDVFQSGEELIIADHLEVPLLVIESDTVVSRTRNLSDGVESHVLRILLDNCGIESTITRSSDPERFYIDLLGVSRRIHAKILRGGANRLIVSDKDISEMPFYAFCGASGGNLGLRHVGTMTMRFAIYSSPHIPQGTMLLGYKGDSYLDSGFVFSPQIHILPNEETSFGAKINDKNCWARIQLE